MINNDLTGRAAAEYRRERERNEAGSRTPAKPNGADAPWRGVFVDDVAENYEDTLARVVPEEAATTAALPLVAASSLAGTPIPPRSWHVEEMIPGRTVTILGGDGGIGKSLIAKQLSVATAAATPWLGRSPVSGPVIYVSAEDDIDELHRRLDAIASGLGVNLSDLVDLHLVPLAGRDAVMAAPEGKAAAITPTRIWRGLQEIVNQVKPRLVVLDTLADVFGGNENARTEARQFIGLLRGLAIGHDLAVLLLAHPSLSGLGSGSGTSGSTAWNNSVRSRLYLETIKDENGKAIDANIRVLSVKKLNYGPAAVEMRLRWSNGLFILDGTAGGFDKLAADAKAERVFLDLLAAFESQGRDVSAKPSRTYAPAVFERNPDAEGVAKRAFEQAMERMLSRGRIRVDNFGPPSKPRSRLVMASVMESDS